MISRAAAQTANLIDETSTSLLLLFVVLLELPLLESLVVLFVLLLFVLLLVLLVGLGGGLFWSAVLLSTAGMLDSSWYTTRRNPQSWDEFIRAKPSSPQVLPQEFLTM
jgi:hypothetical protein